MLENQQILALESNKKIQKLENQLEEERQLNYSFDQSTNDRQNVNTQEAKFTEEVKNVNQPQVNKTAEEDIRDRNKEMPEESNDNSLEEDELLKGNNSSEEINNDPDNKVEQPPKKGFWSRLFGN